MSIKPTEWKRMSFKGNKVWAYTGPQDKPVVEEGKILIKYQLDQEQEYRVHAVSVKPIDSSKLNKKVSRKKSRKVSAKKSKLNESKEIYPDNAICIYTDGASSGNPGPSGIGILLKAGEHEKKISRYIGTATNNIAELEAIRVGLEEIKNKKLPVRVFTDSNYAYGLLVLGWKPKKNQELVESILRLVKGFSDIDFVKVKGHAGDYGNEQADSLATSAIKSIVE